MLLLKMHQIICKYIFVYFSEKGDDIMEQLFSVSFLCASYLYFVRNRHKQSILISDHSICFVSYYKVQRILGSKTKSSNVRGILMSRESICIWYIFWLAFWLLSDVSYSVECRMKTVFSVCEKNVSAFSCNSDLNHT